MHDSVCNKLVYLVLMVRNYHYLAGLSFCNRYFSKIAIQSPYLLFRKDFNRLPALLARVYATFVSIVLTLLSNHAPAAGSSF